MDVSTGPYQLRGQGGLADAWITTNDEVATRVLLSKLVDCVEDKLPAYQGNRI